MKYFLVITLLLYALGAVKAYPKGYNVIKNPSFEDSIERFWEQEWTKPGGYCWTHIPDSTAPDGNYVGLTGAGKEPGAYSALRQSFTKRSVRDFNLNSNNLTFWVKWERIGDKPYKFGFWINPPESVLVYEIPTPDSEEGVWTLHQYNLYKLLKDAGLPDTFPITKIALWARGSLEEGGEEVRWDNIQLLSRFDIDGAIISIDSPLESEVGESYIPKTTLKNVGALEIKGVTAACRIVFDKCGAVYNDTVVSYCIIEPESTLQISFKEWIPEKVSDDYYITVSFLVEGDQNLDNNSLTEPLKITKVTGVEETKKRELIRVEPSIFSNLTGLYLPKGERVKIYDAGGKLVEEICNSDRDGRVSFGSTLKPGIYFYRVKDKVGKVVKID